MRDRDRADVASVLSQIVSEEDALPSHIHVNMMLIFLREFTVRNSYLRDLCDSVAHSDRDKGTAFAQMQKFALYLRMAMEHGGRINFRVLYPIAVVIKELNEVLRLQEVPVIVDVSERTRVRLATALAIALDKTNFHLRGAEGAMNTGWTAEGDFSMGYSVRFRDRIAGWDHLYDKELWIGCHVFLNPDEEATLNTAYAAIRPPNLEPDNPQVFKPNFGA